MNGLRLADYTSQPISVHSCIHRTTPSLQLIWRCWACRMLKVLISIGTIGLTTCKLYLYDHLLTVYLDADFRMYSDLTVKMYAHATLTLSTVSTCNALSFSIPNWTDLKPQSVKWLHFICCVYCDFLPCLFRTSVGDISVLQYGNDCRFCYSYMHGGAVKPKTNRPWYP